VRADYLKDIFAQFVCVILIVFTYMYHGLTEMALDTVKVPLLIINYHVSFEYM
jgi:hypothetical protein